MEIEQTLFSKEIEDLLAKEKVTRMNSDHLETARIISRIVIMKFQNALIIFFF